MPAALDVGEVVVERAIFEDRPRSCATDGDEGDAGPVVAGLKVTAPTDARVFVVRERTSYHAVLGQDATGAYHLRDRSWVKVLAEPGDRVVCRQRVSEEDRFHDLVNSVLFAIVVFGSLGVVLP